MSQTDLPLRKTKCKTCPFRKNSKYGYLKQDLAQSSLSQSRICHSTGSNAINARTGVPQHLCRGARDFQLQIMHGIGLIDTCTDEAWNAKRIEVGMGPTVIQDPIRRAE